MLGALIYASGGAYRTTTEDLVRACWADLRAAGLHGRGRRAGRKHHIFSPDPRAVRPLHRRGRDLGAPVKINDQPSLNDQLLASWTRTGYRRAR